VLAAALVAAIGWFVLGGGLAAAAAPAQPFSQLPSQTPDPPPATTVSPPGPLTSVPDGCPTPEPASVAFVGTVTGKDDVAQVVRFQIDQLRAGSAGPWAIDGLIDVHFGGDYRFLETGHQYLVGAAYDPARGALASHVKPPKADFGGNDVIGVNDKSVKCPKLDSPIRTLNVDGTDVKSGLLTLLFKDRRVLLATLAVPTVIAFVVLLALVILKMLASLVGKGIFSLGRAAVTPVPDHRAVRIRTHRDRDPADSELADSGLADSGA
jgi:hypothetical protein